MGVKAKNNIEIEARMVHGKTDRHESREDWGFAGVMILGDMKKDIVEDGYEQTRVEGNKNTIKGHFSESYSGTVLKRGSSQTVSGNWTLNAKGSVSIESAGELSRKWHSEEHTGFSGIGITTKGGSIGTEVSHKGTVDRVETETLKQVGGEYLTGGEVRIENEEGDITLKGVSMIQGGDLNVEAKKGKVRLEVAEEYEKEKTHHEDKTISLYQGVGNKVVDAAISAQNAYNNAKNALGQKGGTVNSELSRAAKLLEATVSAAQAAYAVKEIAESANSAASFGFYGCLTVTESKVNQDTERESRGGKGTALISEKGNMQLKGERVTLEGATLMTEGKKVIDGKQGVELLSKERSSRQKESSGTESKSITVTVSGGGASTTGEYSKSEQGSEAEEVGHLQTQIRGGGLLIKTEGDAVVKGADVVALS